MRLKYKRRSSAAALWSKRLGIFAFVLLLVSIGAHRLSLLDTADLYIMVAVVGALALFVLLLAVVGFRALWANGDRGGIWSAAGVFFAALCLAPIAWFGFLAVTLPPLHDLSTDLENPPPFALSNRGDERGGNPLTQLPAETVRLQAAAYPAVLGRRYEEPADVVVRAALTVLEERGWPVLAQTGSAALGGSVLVDTSYASLWTGFTYSLVLRVRDETDTSYVDMRSAAHFGRHDFGANAGLIRDFLHDLDFAVATLAN